MKLIIVILISAIILISLSFSVSADLGYSCVGNSTFYNWTEDGTIHNMTTPCLHGCIQGSCRSDASSGTFPLAFIMAYIVIAGIMAYFAMSMDKERHGHIQILFIFLSLYSVIATFGAIQIVIDLQKIQSLGVANLNMFTAFYWSSWAILAYILIVFIRNLIDAMWDIVNERRRKKRGGA